MRIAKSVLVLAAIVLVLAGCGATSTPPDSGSTPDNGSTPDGAYDEGCGECAAELRDIRTQVNALPEVTEIYDISYGQNDNDLRLSAISLQVGIQPDSAQQVNDAVTEIVWKSRLTPVESVVLVMAPPEPADLIDGGAEFIGESQSDFENEWGPRPVN